MAKLDELIEELRESDREDDAQELEKLKGSTLRTKAAKADELEKERDQLAAKVAELETAPKRTKAFEEYGIDLGNLSKAERALLEKYDGELDSDSIGALVEEFELPVNESSTNETDTNEAPAAAKIAQAARRSQDGGSGNKAATVTPQDANGWAIDKQLRFAQQHPDEWEQLKRGETVVGVAA